MGDITLTAAQKAVVNDRGGALLVSAAAGSGKTRVLVERLLRYICDPAVPCSVDDFLVITYTNAAAAELRMKIAGALGERLAQNPENKHLQRQMNRIYLASISTVHGFCANLLRTYAHLLDIPPDFCIAEETEASAMRTRVLNQLLEKEYREQTPDFLAMVDTFGYGRDDSSLENAVRIVYDAMRCRPDMDQWLGDMGERLELSGYTDVLETPWGEYIITEFRGFLRSQIAAMEEALAEMRRYPNIEAGYGKTFAENIRQLRSLEQCESWDDFYGNKVTSFGRVTGVRKPEDAAVKERMETVRKRCWEQLKKWQELIYSPSQTLLADLAEQTPVVQGLLHFVKAFDLAYMEEKRRRKRLDFSDLEHLTIRLLTDRYTGKPTKIAGEIAARYREIMVDEYQDSNQVQEVIFEAISRGGKNRFMVGDVKQSIYQFRLADPTLFLKKYETYPDADRAEEGQPRRILLSENFRSRPEILDACNAVFRLIMRKQVGELDYGEAEALRPGLPVELLPEPAVELHCLTASDPDSGQGKRELEAEFVAARIRRMLDDKMPITEGGKTRPVRPGDITILLRAVSNTAPAYLEALRRQGIPAVSNRGGNLLDAAEVQLLIAMLQVVDNPHQDIPMLALLASPVFAFPAETLARSRARNRRDDFYDVMLSEPKIYAPFLDTLGQLREEASWLPIHELIDRVLCCTEMLAVFGAKKDGVQRKKNLMAFRAASVSFEQGGRRCLPQFLAYLQELREGGGQLPLPQGAGEEAVTIMTSHKSKGLEFPVVFLCDLSKGFNTKDLREEILVDDQLAIGCNRVDTQRFIRYPTLIKKSIERKKKKKMLSEELRILYVAMTRAKERLIMTYYSKNLEDELKKINLQLTRPLRDEVCAGVSNPGQWVLMTALCRTEAGELLNLVGGNAVSQVSELPWRIELHNLTAEQSEPGDAQHAPEKEQPVEIDAQAVSLAQYVYPYEAASVVPSKLTATQLKGRKQDQEISEGAWELKHHGAFQFRKPQFLRRGLTAAEKGTATHLFLQFAEYGKCRTEAGIRDELQRLRAQEFLTPEQAEAVEPQQLLHLFRSEIGSRLLFSAELRREFKFSLLMDAGQLGLDAAGEQVMLQGVVDCFVCEPDGITILDFKTDRIAGDLHQRAAYYRPQLEAYGHALSRIYRQPVKRKLLYFFAAGEFVEI